jgi:hypothetical protein
MKVIVPVAVIAIVLIQMSGLVPQSSVGGPLTLALVMFSAAVIVGLNEASVNKRGALGWLVSVCVSLVGMFLAAEVADLLIGPFLALIKFNGSLMSMEPPQLYAASAFMMLYMLLGCWLALRAVSRWR